MADDWQHGGFGLYVHWPFCQAKCPYCDFNSHVSAEIDQKAWVRAYLTDLNRAAQDVGGRVLNTIFFGGGTPSLMEPDSVAAIIDATKSHWPTSNTLEITLEANPTSVEAGRFQGYKDAGVNRVSMGVQAMNDADLRRLGRLHSINEARAAFDIARNCFDRVSFDLIYARQGQSLSDWQSELHQALDIAVDHVSLYQLTIEQGTAFGDRYAKGKLWDLPNDEDAADMYLATQDICEQHGFPAYETSNHAPAGSESRHNMIYWRYGDYIGIGPGAHGRITIDGQRYATDTHLSPGRWLEMVEGGNGELSRTALNGQEQAQEYLLMGLRLTEGISMERFHALNGQDLPADAIDQLREMNLIETHGKILKTTQQGRPLLNGILRELLSN